MDTASVRMVQQFFLDEQADYAAYQTLTDHERRPALKRVLARFSDIERRHASFWKTVLESQQVPIPAPPPRRLKLWLLRQLQRVINPALLAAALELGESRAVKAYAHSLEVLALDAAQKRSLRSIILEELEHEATFRRESQQLGLSSVRDFVLGMNDGLVEILGAVTGLSAVYVGNPLMVAVSGLVVGIAGALSMGIGAFISVRSQRQVNQGTRERMEVIFDVAPERAVGEYRDQLVGSGVPEDAAVEIADRLGRSRDAITRLLVAGDAEENELRSGVFTGLAYLFGVAFPLVPYFFAARSLVALAFSVAFAGAALAGTAAAVSVLSGISLRAKVLEMVLAGFMAAGLSYGFGLVVQSVTGVAV